MKTVLKLSLLLMLASTMQAIMQALEVPKSSLQIVWDVAEKNLDEAQKKDNQELINKYKNELNELAIKIKKFEAEWLIGEQAKLRLKQNDAQDPFEKNMIEDEIDTMQQEIDRREAMIK